MRRSNMPDADDDAALELKSRCHNPAPGHMLYWVRELLKAQSVDRLLLEALDDGTILVSVDGERRRYWNHEPARLAHLAAKNDGSVFVQEHRRLLFTRTRLSDSFYCFSIRLPGDEHTPCKSREEQVDLEDFGLPPNVAALMRGSSSDVPDLEG
jgi:hypothetical protein